METESLVVYINGKFVPPEDATISIFDLGFLRGDTVYDTTSAWHGWIFKLEAHVARLYDSLRAVKMAIPLSPEELQHAIIDTTRRCGLRDAYIKCLVTRGLPPPGERDLRKCIPTVIIFVVPYVWILPPEKIAHGARVNIASVRSIPPQCLDPRIKSVNRLHFTLATLETYAAGMDETILLDLDGHVTEGPGFNVFMVKHNTLYTSPEGILRGITRDTVLELADENDMATHVTPMTVYDLFAADEVFLSSTAGGLMPVVEVEGRSIGDGRLGPVTKRLTELYWSMREDGRYGTPVFHPA
jgi:branched-chain amino acid aminotransferase